MVFECPDPTCSNSGNWFDFKLTELLLIIFYVVKSVGKVKDKDQSAFGSRFITSDNRSWVLVVAVSSALYFIFRILAVSVKWTELVLCSLYGFAKMKGQLLYDWAFQSCSKDNISI